MTTPPTGGQAFDMRPPRIVLPLLPLAVVLVVAGCSGSSAGEGSGNGAGGPTLTGPQSSAASAAPSETTGIPTPNTPQTASLIAALTAVDPGLAVDDTEAVSNAVSLCGALQDGDDPATAVGSTFPKVELDAAQQQAVVTAVTSTFCTLDGTSTSASATPSAS